MALSSIKKRLWNPGVNNIIGDDSNVLHGLTRYLPDSSARRVFEVFWRGTTEASELGGAATSVFDGTTTPQQIIVVSASASDTDGAAGHVRKVAVIGLAVKSQTAYLKGSSDAGYEAPQAYVEVVNMNGTTNVTTTLYFLRLVHIYACDWGSGDDDAAGNITAEYPENTALLTIVAGTNESSGGILYFPEARAVHHCYIMCDQYGAPTANLDGFDLTINYNGFENALNADGDYEDKSISINDQIRHIETTCFDPVPHYAELDAQITYTLAVITNAPTGQAHAIVSF